MKKVKIIIVVGTRSEIVKFSSLIRKLKRETCFDVKILHTGQHDTRALMEKLDLPKPDFNLGTAPRGRWSKKGKINSSFLAIVWLLKIFFRMRRIFVMEMPDAIFYQGNCMSVPMAIFSAKTVSKKIIMIHRESGIRTHTLFEPFLGDVSERVGDYFGNILFAPSAASERNLIDEGFGKKTVNVGDPHVEIVEYVLKKLKSTRRPIEGNYIVVNVLHFENVTNKNKMQNLVEILTKSPVKVVFPVSASVKGRLELFGLLDKLKDNKNIIFAEPYNFSDFIHLMKKSDAVLTDSGGVQQESLILKIPCIFLGKENVWKEFENMGVIKSTGFDVDKTLELLQEIKNMGAFYKKVKATNYPLGDGKSTDRMVKVLKKELFNSI